MAPATTQLPPRPEPSSRLPGEWFSAFPPHVRAEISLVPLPSPAAIEMEHRPHKREGLSVQIQLWSSGKWPTLTRVSYLEYVSEPQFL